MSTCVNLVPTTSHGIWQGDNPIHFSLSLLIIQILLILTLTRLLGLLLKPLRQPLVIAEIIGGILLGPSALGRNTAYLSKIFTKQSISILTTFANLGLMFFLFMVGLELDLASIRRTGRQAAAISIAGICIPFVSGIGISFLLHNTINTEPKFVPFMVFMGVALSITAFPVLARILAERRLLTTDVGKMAISAAAADDVVAWIFLALAVALSGTGRSPLAALWILLCGVAFVIAMFVLVRPAVVWMHNRSPGAQHVNELYVCMALGGVLVSGFITDFIGIHGIFGAFIFGLLFPQGHLSQVLIEKLEDFVRILMLPLYFAASGLQTNVGSISGGRSFGLLVLVVLIACGGKILGVLAVSMAYGQTFRKALTLGFLMNTKGLVELIVLNIGKERKVLNEEMFAIMVLMALFTTFITTPVVMALYKPARDPVPYKRRGLSERAGEEPLRFLACVHGITNVPAMVDLVEATRGGGGKEALRLYVLELSELSERSSAIMMVQRVRREGFPFSRAANSSSIAVAFGAYSQLNKVVVRSLTGISRLEDMHEDVCAAAADKRTALIVLPFHKYARAPGSALETMNPGFQMVNQRVLANAPCSVGILVDKGGSSSSAREQVSLSSVDRSTAVLFFGGPDDREALLLGLRIAQHPGVKLSVIRFISNSDAQVLTESGLGSSGRSDHRGSGSGSGRGSIIRRISSSVETSYQVVPPANLDEEAQQDEEAISKLKQRLADVEAPGASLVELEEVMVGEGDVLDAVLRAGRMNQLGMVIVGRGRRPVPALRTLTRRPATHAELGPVGDALTVDVEVHASVLVIQQYDPALALGSEDHSNLQ